MLFYQNTAGGSYSIENMEESLRNFYSVIRFQ